MILLAATAGRRNGTLLRSCGACAAVGILALTACQGAGQARVEAESEVLPSSPALHQVNDVRLREIMRELSELELTDIAIQMKQSGQPHPELRRIAEMAVPLARDARVLSITFRSTSMPPESRRMFDALAMQLRDEASSLADAAERQNVSEVNACTGSLPRAMPVTRLSVVLRLPPPGCRRVGWRLAGGWWANTTECPCLQSLMTMRESTGTLFIAVIVGAVLIVLAWRLVEAIIR